MRNSHLQDMGRRQQQTPGTQPRKRATDVGAGNVMPGGGPTAVVRGTDVIKPATPDPSPTPEGHDDTNPNYDRVRSNGRDYKLLSPTGADDYKSQISVFQDEHGQSMLHFAAARTHGRNALIQLIEESGVNIAYRDELYRTPRDVAIQAGQPGNAKEIDKYIMSLAARGDLESFQNLLHDGYDHVLDIADQDNNSVMDVARSRGHKELLEFLERLQELEVKILPFSSSLEIDLRVGFVLRGWSTGY